MKRKIAIDSSRSGELFSCCSGYCEPTQHEGDISKFRFWSQKSGELFAPISTLRESQSTSIVDPEQFKSCSGFFFVLNRVSPGKRVCRTTTEGIAPGINYRLDVGRRECVHLTAVCENRPAYTEVNNRARLSKLRSDTGSIRMAGSQSRKGLENHNGFFLLTQPHHRMYGATTKEVKT